MGLVNLRFVSEPLSDAGLASLVSSANALVLPIKKQVFPDVSFPGKLIEYVQSGRPTILVGEGYPAELVTRYQVGVTVAPGDYRGLVSAIKQLKEDVALANRISANAKRVGAEEFGEKALNESLAQVLAAVA
jgi:glycosyltransferase involved in cell wall biosynthesis